MRLLRYVDQIERLARERGMTAEAVAVAAGVAATTLLRARREGRDISEKVARKMLEALECPTPSDTAKN